MTIEKKLDIWAGDLLEYLSEILPKVNDDGLLGEEVLKRALEAYQIAND